VRFFVRGRRLKFFFLFIVLVVGQAVFAQQNLPIIRANSKITDIIDDGILMKSIWNITPGVKPEIYYIMKSEKIKK
jgi:hypothetical protein